MASIWLGLPLLLGLSVTFALLARRWLPPRSAAATWIGGLPIAVMPVAAIWAGAALMPSSVVLGATFVLGGAAFLALWVLYTRRAVVKVRAAETDADIEAAIEEPFADMSVVWAALLLLGGFLAVALLVAALLIMR